MFSKPIKGKLNNMVEYFKNEAENLMNDYNGLINGLFVRNPGTKGYTVRVSILKFLLYFDRFKPKWTMISHSHPINSHMVQYCF